MPFYPWYSNDKVFKTQQHQPGQSHQGFSNGIFDNLKINSNIHGTSAMTQTPYGAAQLIPGGGLGFAIPIDQMDQEEDQQRQQAQSQPNNQAPHAAYNIFCHAVSPRI